MNPKLEETIYVDFITASPTTGAAIDADSTPSCEVFEDATDTGIITPTPAKRTGKTGDYRVQIDCTAANGFESAKSYNVVVSATVGGVAAKAVIASIIMRTRCIDDVSTITAADVWASGTRTLTSFGTLVADTATAVWASGTRTLTSFGTLVADTASAVWASLTSALTTVGSIGKLLVDRIDATITSRMATYTQPTGFLAATFPSGTIANTTNITAGTLTTVTTATNLTTNNDKTGYALTAAYDPAKTAAQAGDAMTLTSGERTSVGTAVWASATRSLTTFGTLIADIWASASRTLTAFGFSVTVGTNNDKTDYTLTAAYDAAKTALQSGGSVVATNMRGTDNALLAADYVTPPTGNAIADAVLDRNIAGGSSTGRKVKEALAFLRNKWTLVGTTLTVYDTDDSTVLWTSDIATDPAATPVTGSDPT